MPQGNEYMTKQIFLDIILRLALIKEVTLQNYILICFKFLTSHKMRKEGICIQFLDLEKMKRHTIFYSICNSGG